MARDTGLCFAHPPAYLSADTSSTFLAITEGCELVAPEQVAARTQLLSMFMEHSSAFRIARLPALQWRTLAGRDGREMTAASAAPPPAPPPAPIVSGAHPLRPPPAL
ncbi:Protein of unknown function [Gryllus bimaculatus]|nr:Protein of unknown function [Gryllus bimaculatus]